MQNRYNILAEGEDKIDDDYYQKHQHQQVKSAEAEDVEKREPTYDIEEMSCTEITKVIDLYNDRNTNTTKEYKQCKEMTKEYNSLICKYKRVERYMIDQETQIEEIRNNNYYITLINYLEMSGRKAQIK